MALDLPRWKVVQRHRIAIGATTGSLWRVGGNVSRKWSFQLSRGKQSRLRGAPRPRRMPVAPDTVAPLDNLASLVEIGLDLDRHSCAEWGMRHLVLTRPLHADRPAARRLGQQNRIQRDVVGTVVAVATRAFHVLDRDILDRYLQDEREVSPEKVDALAVGQHVNLLARPLGDGARGCDRGMGEIGAGVPSAHGPLCFTPPQRRWGGGLPAPRGVGVFFYSLSLFV